MSKITKLEQQKKDKKRFNLFIDGEFFLGVDIDTVVAFNLTVDREIGTNELSEIVISAEKNTALNKSLNYISRSRKTKKQVKEYLQNKEYSNEIINFVLEKLIDYKFIDDLEYCKAYVRSYQNKKGKNAIERDLRLKGIDFNLIDKALDEELSSQDFAVLDIAKKYMKNRELSRENLAKLYRHILSKGFTYEQASTAVSFIKGDE